jgi:hypothetical protein
VIKDVLDFFLDEIVILIPFVAQDAADTEIQIGSFKLKNLMSICLMRLY